tara:strand:+ start:2050 stop:2760 length:711 start_codon:yes stop_codon:yes gene_type:complete
MNRYKDIISILKKRMMQFSSTENIDIIREVLNDQRIPNIGHLTERYFVKKVNSFVRANDTSDLMEANKKFINELLSSIQNDTIDYKEVDEGVLPQKLEDNYGNLYRAERPSTPTFEDKKDECPLTLERELNEAMAARNYDQNIYNTRENVTNKIVIDHESDVSEIEESLLKEEPNKVVSKEEEGKKIISRLRIVEKNLNNILQEVSGNGLKEPNYTNLVLATERLEISLSQVNTCL